MPTSKSAIDRRMPFWAKGDGPYPVQFFHLGKLFQAPVRMHLVRDGMAREILYSPRLFAFGQASFAAALPDDSGFAGFRVMHSSAQQRDWLAFLGAAYFRSAGELDQYGLSARGIAIDTGLPTPEEFPNFISLWLEPAPDPRALLIHALMDGPSISGAYRFLASYQERVVMDVEAALFARTAITRLGIAPMTSMFWYSETNHMQARDWRPEIHDSDGLALWTGAGERIWRPLNNPLYVQTSSFFDKSITIPRDSVCSSATATFKTIRMMVFFMKNGPACGSNPSNPGAKEPCNWSKFPTDYEIADNIVAYWVPQAAGIIGYRWDTNAPGILNTACSGQPMIPIRPISVGLSLRASAEAAYQGRRRPCPIKPRSSSILPVDHWKISIKPRLSN